MGSQCIAPVVDRIAGSAASFMRLLFSCIAGLILGWSPVVFAYASTAQKEPALNENYFG
jgi:hypothetical protein